MNQRSQTSVQIDTGPLKDPLVEPAPVHLAALTLLAHLLAEFVLVPVAFTPSVQ